MKNLNKLKLMLTEKEINYIVGVNGKSDFLKLHSISHIKLYPSISLKEFIIKIWGYPCIEFQSKCVVCVIWNKFHDITGLDIDQYKKKRKHLKIR